MTAAHDRYGYSAITDRPPGQWPNNTGLALYVALGVEDYAFAEGQSEDILPGVLGPDLVNTAWRDYGNRVGGFRLLDRLGEYGIRPAALLNTGVYDSAPTLITALRAAGAEFIAHGQRNSDNLATMEEAEERDYINATVARIALEEGKTPGGWSSPWLSHSFRSLDLLAECGLAYLLDLRLDDQPVWLRTTTRPLLAIPYATELNDSTTVIGRQSSARDFADMIVDEFDEMLLASAERPLVMNIVLHSFISGQPFRMRALSKALDHIFSHREQIWFTQPREIARLVGHHPELAV